MGRRVVLSGGVAFPCLLCFALIRYGYACFSSVPIDEDCNELTSQLDNIQAFGPGLSPCAAQDCSESPCECSLNNSDSRTVSADQCPDGTTIAVTTSDGQCTLRETPVGGFQISCVSGFITASGFSDGQGDVDMVTLLSCACPDTPPITLNDGTCTIREVAVPGGGPATGNNNFFELTCVNGEITATGFTDGLGDAVGVMVIACECPPDVTGTTPAPADCIGGLIDTVEPNLLALTETVVNTGICGDPIGVQNLPPENCNPATNGNGQPCTCSLMNGQSLNFITGPCLNTFVGAFVTSAGCVERTVQANFAIMTCVDGVIQATNFDDDDVYDEVINGVTAFGCNCPLPT